MQILRALHGPAVTLFAVLTLSLSTSLWAGNWPAWRGPTGNGICTEKNLPTEWDRTKNVAWRFELPGPGGATPAVWGDRVFVTTVDGNELLLLCVSTDGKQLWRRVLGRGDKIARGDEGNAASPSPTTDGKHVWAMMTNGDIACYDVDGREVWKMNLQDRYGKFNIAFGMTSTPILYKGRLYLQLIHGDRKASTQEALVLAMNALTGRGIWKQDRVTGAYAENEHSYASPALYDDGKLTFLITHGADYCIAYRLVDGHELWRLGGLNPQDDPKRRYHPTLRLVASPVAAPGIIVVPTAKNGPVFAIKPNFRGDITHTKSAHIWTRSDNTPDVPSPLIHQGLVYLCRENGNLICIEADTGKQLYNERTHRTRHRASPVFADGKIYLTARDGKVTVVRAGRTFKILAQNDLRESVSASLAISNGTIYIRSYDALWAIRNR